MASSLGTEVVYGMLPPPPILPAYFNMLSCSHVRPGTNPHVPARGPVAVPAFVTVPWETMAAALALWAGWAGCGTAPTIIPDGSTGATPSQLLCSRTAEKSPRPSASSSRHTCNTAQSFHNVAGTASHCCGTDRQPPHGLRRSLHHTQALRGQGPARPSAYHPPTTTSGRNLLAPRATAEKVVQPRPACWRRTNTANVSAPQAASRKAGAARSGGGGAGGARAREAVIMMPDVTPVLIDGEGLQWLGMSRLCASSARAYVWGARGPGPGGGGGLLHAPVPSGLYLPVC